MSETLSSSKMPERVVVVGAGLSGLAAATELRRRGCEVTVLEQSKSPGGRCAGESLEGFSIERSLPLLYGSDRRLLNFLAAVRADDMLPLRPVQVAQPYGKAVQPIDPRSPWRVSRIPAVKLREALRLVRLPRLMSRYRPLLDPEAPEQAADWDYRSAADFGSLYFGKTVVDEWMEPALASYSEPASELSRVVFLLDWLASDEGNAGSFLLQGGLHEAARLAAEWLQVRFERAVTRIEGHASSSLLQVHTDSESFEADAVVVATGARIASSIAVPLLSLAERDVFAELASGPEITLSVALDRELTGIPQLIRVPRRERSSIRSLLLDPGGPGLRAPMGAGLATLAASDEFCRSHAGAPADVVEKALLAELARIYRRASGRERFTKLERRADSVPLFRVGVCRALRRFQRVQLDLRAQGRKLYFAGDYLVGPRAENAVASGMRAARACAGEPG